MKLRSFELLLLACSVAAPATAQDQAPLYDSASTSPSTSSNSNSYEPGQRHSISVAASEELLSLHESLVRIESISNNEEEVGRWLAEYLEDKGFEVELQEVEEHRYNVYAWTGEKGDAKVLVSSHIDTVPPFIPYTRHANGTISGRGTVDAKGSVAAQVIAVLDVLDAYKQSSLKIAPPVSLLFVVDEETGGQGMQFFSKSALNRKDYDVVIFGEPTEGKLAGGHKGITLFKVVATGRAAHSGYPWLGLSANDVLVQALNEIKTLEAAGGFPESEKFGNTTLNVGQISGGVANNVVAANAEANIAVRIADGTPSQIIEIAENAIGSIQAFAQSKGGDLEIEWTHGGYGPIQLDCDVEELDCLTVNYGTDVPNLEVSQATKRYLYGPGTILVAHGANEAITVEQLEDAVVGYKKLLLNAFGADDDTFR